MVGSASPYEVEFQVRCQHVVCSLRLKLLRRYAIQDASANSGKEGVRQGHRLNVEAYLSCIRRFAPRLSLACDYREGCQKAAPRLVEMDLACSNSNVTSGGARRNPYLNISRGYPDTCFNMHHMDFTS